MIEDDDIFSVERPISTFEEQASNVLRTMLRTALGYASDKPDAVYVYIQINEEKASMDALYRINNKFYETNTLNNSHLKNFTFDVSVERQKQLLQYLSKDLTESLLPLFLQNKKALPNEIWTSYDLKTNEQSTTYGYGFDVPLLSTSDALAEWKQKLVNPDPVLEILRKIDAEMGVL